MMASHLWPLWWLPQLLGRGVCCLKRGWLESLKGGLLTLTSSWPVDVPAWNQSPYRTAWSNPVFLLTGGLEGPELPTYHPLPLLKHKEGQHWENKHSKRQNKSKCRLKKHLNETICTESNYAKEVYANIRHLNISIRLHLCLWAPN